MKRKTTKQSNNQKSIFTDLDKDIKRENQIYINDEILEAVIDAKRKASDKNTQDVDTIRTNPVPSTVKIDNAIANIPEHSEENTASISEPKDGSVQNETHPDDLSIYDSLFSETTVVSTQIYTYEMDKHLGKDNFTSDCVYRAGQDISDIGTIFTITKETLKAPISISRPHSHSDLSWYNDLAALGFSYAAVCGTTVQGVIICEPQLWNNTLYIRHLMVEKGERFNGIGRKLVEECENSARSEGFRALTLEVTSSNGAAIDFYRHMNFNIVGINIGLYTNSDLLKGDVAVFMHKIIL